MFNWARLAVRLSAVEFWSTVNAVILSQSVCPLKRCRLSLVKTTLFCGLSLDNNYIRSKKLQQSIFLENFIGSNGSGNSVVRIPKIYLPKKPNRNFKLFWRLKFLEILCILYVYILDSLIKRN